MERVQRRYEMVHDLEATFTQKATLKTLNETQLSSGKVYIKKPGRMRWDYLKPDRQVILLDNGMLRIYTPDLKQVVEQPVTNVYKAKAPTAFLAGRAKLTDLFTVRFEPVEGNSQRLPWRLVLTPKEPNPQLKELLLEVAPGTFDIVRSIIIDHFGNITDIRYSKIRVNKELDESIFTLDLPPDVERLRPPPVPLE
jgi:outer membrane lipoprotein carrier protein